jgi:thiol-disulfide isomerase/thioredoxin
VIWVKTRFISMALLLLLYVTSFMATEAAQVKPEVGFQAPNATVLDLQGNPVQIASLIEQNKVTLIHFWTTWCPYCQREMPYLRTLYAQYSDKGLGIAAISFNEKPTVVRNYVSKNSPQFPIYTDEPIVAHKAYQVYVIPVTFVVGQDGIIRQKIGHQATYDTFERAIKPFLEDE